MNEYFTIEESLQILNVTDAVVFKLFEKLGLLHASYPTFSKWCHEVIHQQLLNLYKSRLYCLHPDKGGTGEASHLHDTKKAWKTLKAHYVEPIDLALDDDVVAADDQVRDIESSSIEDSIYDDSDNDEPSKDVNENRFMLTDSVEGAMDMEYRKLVGEIIWKRLWFQGRVISLDIGKVEGVAVVLFNAEYDDGDREDYEVDEWKKALKKKSICLDETSTNIDDKYSPLGATMWKKFKVKGEVTHCSMGK